MTLWLCMLMSIKTNADVSLYRISRSLHEETYSYEFLQYRLIDAESNDTYFVSRGNLSGKIRDEKCLQVYVNGRK